MYGVVIVGVLLTSLGFFCFFLCVLLFEVVVEYRRRCAFVVVDIAGVVRMLSMLLSPLLLTVLSLLCLFLVALCCWTAGDLSVKGRGR